MTSQQLRDLAAKAYNKQWASTKKHHKPTTGLSITTPDQNLTLEGPTKSSKYEVDTNSP